MRKRKKIKLKQEELLTHSIQQHLNDESEDAAEDFFVAPFLVSPLSLTYSKLQLEVDNPFFLPVTASTSVSVLPLVFSSS